MDKITERLRYIRESWGLSARKLSIDLALNESSWGVYESGSSLPGASVLAKLVARNVNINWLLSGEGEPFQEQGQDVAAVLERLERSGGQQLGISHLMLLATQANIHLRMKILDFLATHAPGSLKLQEIVQATEKSETQVVLALIELIRTGQVKTEYCGQEKVEKYRAATDKMWTNAANEGDTAELTLEAIRFLSHDIAPSVGKNPDSAILVIATAGVQDGRGFIQELQQFLRERSTTLDATGLETVKLLFAAKIESS